jgi:hypothetical protein
VGASSFNHLIYATGNHTIWPVVNIFLPNSLFLSQCCFQQYFWVKYKC